MAREKLSALLERLGVEIPLSLVRTALTHSSYANEVGGEDNERLEFLGDAVLDLALADFLYRQFPERDEGELSKIRAVVVSRPVLAQAASRLGLGAHLLLGKGEELAGGRKRPSILAAALEALFGAVFLLGQRRYGALPAYDLVDSEGPEHEKVFTVSVELGGSKALGRGRSKKEAEQAAAKRLYLDLEEREEEPKN